MRLQKIIVTACIKGGAICVEMTNRGDRVIDGFKELEEFCSVNYPEVIFGGGLIV